MTPTPKLRFIMREFLIDSTTAKYEKVLQQWWQSDRGEWIGLEFVFDGEWRDIPAIIGE